MNKFQVIGNLTQDISIETKGETKYCRFTVAVNRHGVEKTDFFEFTAFNKLAELIEKYCKKGNKVYVEARAEQNVYQTEEGEKRYSVQFIANDVEFLSPKPKGEEPFD